MSISNAQHTEKEHHISSEIIMEPAADSSAATLETIIHRSGFSSVAQRLQALLQEMGGGVDGGIEQRLFSNVSALQDYFIDTLYRALSRDHVDMSHKIALRLDENDRLALFEEHPDEAQISGLLEKYPGLSAVFVEIAAQSSALRDLRSLQQLVSTGRMPECSPKYRLSLKGEMSHFYFYG